MWFARKNYVTHSNNILNESVTDTVRSLTFFSSSVSPFGTETGSFVLAWKRGIAILTAGQIKVSPDPRVRLVNGYTLQIRDAVPSDAGDYICQIGTLEPREITHHVEILSKKFLSSTSEICYSNGVGCGKFITFININYPVPFQ